MRKLISLFIAALLLLSFTMLGCADKNNSATINTTSAGAAQSANFITGTVQGYLLDAVTQQPIAGAVIDIGVAQATTTSDGQYVLRNVPANQSNIRSNPLPDGTTQEVVTSFDQSYFVTINMKGVTSPVAMGDTTKTPRYPDYKFETLQVRYESISNIVSAGSGSTAGGTYVLSVLDVTNQDYHVGKLSANISGVVGGCKGTSTFYTPVGAAYTVRLRTASGSDNSTSGEMGNIVTTATTDANGAFTFSNVEAGESFYICASDAGHTMEGCADGNASIVGDQPFTMPADGQTLVLAIQESTAVHVCSTDVHGPAVTAVTPENGADLTPGAVNVVFTFSEPIKQTAYAQRLTVESIWGGAAGLYNDVSVNYTGTKASNISYTLSWNATFDSLTVAIPTTATSSVYEVDIHLADLVDASDLCVDTNGNSTCDKGEAAITGKNKITFTTKGGAAAAAPTIALTNSASLNNTGSPNLDWVPVSGAKSYNVYRRTNQVWPTTTNSHSYERLANVTTSEYGDGALNFVENDVVKLTFDYYVTSVNSDGTESSASTAVTAQDVLGPQAGPSVFTLAGTSVWRLDLTDNDDTLQVFFDEPMNETSVEAATYTISVATGTVPTVTSAVYHIGAGPTYYVDLTLSGNLNPANLGPTQIFSGANGVCEYALVGDDVGTIVSGNGSPNAVCVTENVAGTAATTAAGDDVQVVAVGAATTVGATIINAGPDGVCNTTAAGGENQVIPLSQGSPNKLCADAGADLWLSSTMGGDDTVTSSTVLSITGGSDVAGNTIRTTANQLTTDGQRQ